MRLFALVISSALALAGAPRAADVHETTLSPEAAVSFPFGCNWGYDWEERCYREDGARLPVGGEPGKVWRAALRFPTLPRGTTVLTAELSLWYDGTCLAPLRASRRCDGRGFGFGLHPIFSAGWFAEREVEFGPQVGTAELGPFATPQWVVWDVTDLVAEWTARHLVNNGLLIKLADDQEDVGGGGGPLFPSSSHPSSGIRPRLTIWYLLE